MNVQKQLAMEFMLLTFTRTKELRLARWEEFNWDEGLWYIPGERMKMGKPHIVPLSKQSLEILIKLKHLNGHREWVFPGHQDPRKPMSDGALMMVLDRMGYRGIHTGHGFRALAMTTIMEKLGYSYEIPDIQLAHAKAGDVRRAYDRTTFLQQRIKMMQDWANYLEG